MAVRVDYPGHPMHGRIIPGDTRVGVLQVSLNARRAQDRRLIERWRAYASAAPEVMNVICYLVADGSATFAVPTAVCGRA